MTCTECGRKAIARQLCSTHYNAAKSRGDLVNLPRLTPEQRFAERVARYSPDECWMWSNLSPGRYGSLLVDGVKVYAHRFSYELHNGPIPLGMYVLHSCDTPACVNPRHLSVGDQKQNVQEMWARGRANRRLAEACKWGHKFTAENTRINSDGERVCRTCCRERARRYRWSVAS